jgi:hypothetical protein
MKPICFAGSSLAAAVFALPLAAQRAEPLHIRNLNPVVAIFGLPAWDVPERGTTLSSTFEVANHFRFSLRGSDRLVLDGETLRTTVAITHGFEGGWSVGAELPYYRIGGGVLDDVIDGWHSAFGLPDGGRDNRPEGALLFELGDGNGQFLGFTAPQSGIGDVQLKAARRFGADGGFVVQGALKLATGDADSLMGSGSADFGLTLLRSRDLPDRRRPAGYYWGVGVLLLGEPDRVRFAAEDVGYTAIVGGSWQPWPKFGLKAQLDFHSALFNTPLEELGEDAIEATIGAWRPAGRRGLVEFALVEDLEVSTAPDVVLQVAARWHW